MVLGGFVLTLIVFYPGVMTNDASYVYKFAKNGNLGDWQSPLMSMLWGLIDPLAPGAASMFLCIAILYWMAFGFVAVAVARRSSLLGMIVPLVALCPPAFHFLGMIWRDVLFGAVWLLAAAIVYAAVEQTTGVKRAAQALALFLIGFGILLRPNAIIAAPLLIGYVIFPTRFDARRTAILFLPALLAGFGLIQVVYYGMLDVKRQHPLHSLLVFDIGGITHFTGVNQFPVTWTDGEMVLLTTRCYNPRRWDSYWTIPPCNFAMQRLERPDDIIFGTPKLVAAWWQAVTAHPLAYLQHRLTFTRTFVSPADLTLELYNADDSTNAPLTHNRYFRALTSWHTLFEGTPLFSAGLWLAMATVVGAFGWRSRGTPSGAFAVSVAACGAIYVLTYVVFGVATDFRYSYWCVLASLAGVMALIAAQQDRRVR
jgi:hypothetical protein